jgi:para-aminobenzoate synthetase component 1
MTASIPFVPFSALIHQMDAWGMAKTPFYFFISYDGQQAWAGSKKEAQKLGLQFQIREKTPSTHASVQLKKFPISIESYRKKFDLVLNELKKGNSFLLNLTAETPIEFDASFQRIFDQAQAPYKLKCGENFIVFSPECFIQIKDGKIFSFPMKGTSSVRTNPSNEALRSDKKEQAEHATIVDLIRNDLSRVAFPIQVDSYKFIEQIKTNEGDLWQMSSQISGTIMPEFSGKIGSILSQLLPAGSITGAPKPSTIDIINRAEAYERGFYTGIMGEFDGNTLDSGVMIRFIENKQGEMIFKSGGGITVFSELEKEYNELIQKVYLPF